MKRLVGNSFPPYWYPDSIGENRMSLSASFKTRGTFPRGLWVSTKTISSCLEPEWTTWDLKLGQLCHWQQVSTCETIGEGEVRGWDRPQSPARPIRDSHTECVAAHALCWFSVCFSELNSLFINAEIEYLLPTFYKTGCTMLCSVQIVPFAITISS